MLPVHGTLTASYRYVDNRLSRNVPTCQKTKSKLNLIADGPKIASVSASRANAEWASKSAGRERTL